MCVFHAMISIFFCEWIEVLPVFTQEGWICPIPTPQILSFAPEGIHVKDKIFMFAITKQTLCFTFSVCFCLWKKVPEDWTWTRRDDKHNLTHFPLHSLCLMALATNAVSVPSDQISRALCADLMLALFPSRGFDRMCPPLLAFDVFPPAFSQLCFWILFKLCLTCRKVFCLISVHKVVSPLRSKTPVFPSLLLALAFFKPTFSPRIRRFWDFTKIFTSPHLWCSYFFLSPDPNQAHNAGHAWRKAIEATTVLWSQVHPTLSPIGPPGSRTATKLGPSN